jgi:hypothetical protein
MKKGYVDLQTLTREHPMRNAPLVVIAARRRFLPGSPTVDWRGIPHPESMQEPERYPWKYVLPTWKIANNTFNEIERAWSSPNTQWQGRMPEEKVAPEGAETYPVAP